MDTEELAKAIVGIRRMMRVDIRHAIIIMEEVITGFQEREEKIEQMKQNLKVVIMNVKPEYLQEMKKLIVPEVFDSLGL